MLLLDYLQHRRECRFKQDERASRIAALSAYKTPFSALDRDIISRPIEELVRDVQADAGRAADLLRTYTKVALNAHDKTNCVTEVLVKDAEKWIKDGSINFKGSLAGIPVSLKDTIDVKGYDSSVGMTRNVLSPKAEDGAMTRLLKDIGAVPYVKTNVPITLLSFESANDVWGRSTNPYNPKYTPGGSTGGEGALLALGGRIGIGSDVAGSDGVPAVYSPMARTMNDLTYFTRAVLERGTWNYDPSCHPMPWRSDVVKEYRDKKRLRVGVFRTDGVIDPSPACKRALDMTEAALRRAGHQIVEIDPPSPYEGLYLASRLLCADGLATVDNFFRTGEWNDRGAAQMRFYAKLPRFVNPTSTQEYWALIARREAYKRGWFEMWDRAGLDFIIAPPNATPAVPHNGMHDAVSSCAYTFLFNLIDYSAGVIPVTHVDRAKDRLPRDFNIGKLNGIARGAYKLYNADEMHGLPVGVQVIGRRLEEEKVLTLMERVEDALGEDKFRLLEVD
ncbi:amidase domain-containing protein [Hirsutella rhossiliensis]|uniref:Amidase domain-containing protein n=1 Tax=Hirsutella rhossiliensis TaxID=111463 RepID=A0A9P8MM59_9HYPO|nr:amidase domain-containing protein [Hirsutella rhossiliensis]KAH0957857.1 amidase domain-containing protein [Hirsutella rhossiliensis]